MAAPWDVIVVGLGALGSSACWQMARRGMRVLGLEQFGIPHAFGSSHGDSRMIRLCYAEHPDYVPLLVRAYELWRELERVSERRLLHVTGGLYIGAPEGAFVAGAERAARAHGLPHEMLDAGAIRRRHPQFHVSPPAVALYEPNAGLILAERAVATQAEQALRAGAELHGFEAVTEWRSGAGEIEVETSRGHYRAERLCVCGGPWSDRLLGDLGVRLRVTRQVVGWVWPRKPECFLPSNFPVWAIEEPDCALTYGFPLIAERPGLKVGRHAPGPETSPDTIDRTPRAEDESEFRAPLARSLPDADGPLLTLQVCMYTNTPDGHFIVDRHPRDPRVFLACGTSGHGFKFASVLGEVLADLAAERTPSPSIGFLGLERFARA